MKKIFMLLTAMVFVLSFVACDRETGSNADESNFPASESGKSGKEFTYMHDKWNLYKAIQLSETTFKIENWGRYDAGEDGDSFKHHYDVCVISTDDASTDFKWLDDTQTAFSITLHDKENGRWEEECLVTFVTSSNE